MAASSKSRSNASVLHLSRSSTPSQPSDPFSSPSQPSNFASSPETSIFDRPLSPTRVHLSHSSVSPFRISLNTRSNAVSVRNNRVSNPASFAKRFLPKKTCMCSPTTHPGSFRCSYHRNSSSKQSSSINYSPNRLNLRRSAMTNSLVRIGTVEGDWVRRALTALIRPSSHQQRRRSSFETRPSRLSIMSKAGNDVV